MTAYGMNATHHMEGDMDKSIIQANRVINKLRESKMQFYALHGILCMDHGADYQHSTLARQFINGMAIAKRLDDVRSERDIIGPLLYDAHTTH